MNLKFILYFTYPYLRFNGTHNDELGRKLQYILAIKGNLHIGLRNNRATYAIPKLQLLKVEAPSKRQNYQNNYDNTVRWNNKRTFFHYNSTLPRIISYIIYPYNNVDSLL